MHVKSNRCVECGAIQVDAAKAGGVAPSKPAPVAPPLKSPGGSPRTSQAPPLEPPKIEAPRSPLGSPRNAHRSPQTSPRGPAPVPSGASPPAPRAKAQPHVIASEHVVVSHRPLPPPPGAVTEHDMPAAVVRRPQPPIPGAGPLHESAPVLNPIRPAPPIPAVKVARASSVDSSPVGGHPRPAPPVPPVVMDDATQQLGRSSRGETASQLNPPAVPHFSKRLTHEKPKVDTPTVPDASKRRGRSGTASADSASSLIKSAGAVLVDVPNPRRGGGSNSTPPDDCLATLQDPYWRTRFQSFAIGKNPGHEGTFTFWTLVDEFKCASNSQIRVVLANRIYSDYVGPNAPQAHAFVGGEDLRKLIGQEFVKIGAANVPSSFFDGPYMLALDELQKVWSQWKESQNRNTVGPKMESSLSRSTTNMGGGTRQHRRSASFNDEVSSGQAIQPSPYAVNRSKLPSNVMPVRPAVKKSKSDPKIVAAPVKNLSRTSHVPPHQPYQHHGVENMIGDDEWEVESVLSDSCTFEWARLHVGNTNKIEVIKCLVVGDMNVGKTQLCKTMLGDSFSAEYSPTVFETYKIRVPLFKTVPIELWDMSGNPKYDRKRPVVYPNINCFLVCFDITNRESWKSVKKKWVPEALSFPDFPMLIVGCKFDTINSSNAVTCVTAEDVSRFMDKHCISFKCYRFFSASAKNGSGLAEIFQALVYTTLYEKAKKDELNSTFSAAKDLVSAVTKK